MSFAWATVAAFSSPSCQFVSLHFPLFFQAGTSVIKITYFALSLELLHWSKWTGISCESRVWPPGATHQISAYKFEGCGPHLATLDFNILAVSVWPYPDAKWSGVDLQLVIASMLAPCFTRYLAVSVWPYRDAR